MESGVEREWGTRVGNESREQYTDEERRTVNPWLLHNTWAKCGTDYYSPLHFTSHCGPNRLKGIL